MCADKCVRTTECEQSRSRRCWPFWLGGNAFKRMETIFVAQTNNKLYTYRVSSTVRMCIVNNEKYFYVEKPIQSCDNVASEQRKKIALTGNAVRATLFV